MISPLYIWMVIYLLILFWLCNLAAVLILTIDIFLLIDLTTIILYVILTVIHLHGYLAIVILVK